jgi:hypothetical protein
MDVLNYDELPNKVKGLFKSKIEAELIQDHKKMGIEKPQAWQMANHLDYCCKKYLFHNDHGNYYFFKLEKLG